MIHTRHSVELDGRSKRVAASVPLVPQAKTDLILFLTKPRG